MTSRPDGGIAQVGEVAGDGAGLDVGAADLDEGADLDAVLQHGPVAQVGERADPAVRADLDRSGDHA